jgi:hypothetical protein
MRAWQVSMLLAALMAGLYGMKQYRHYKEDQEIESRRQAALRGNPVLTVPENLPIGSKEKMFAVKPCRPGLLVSEYPTCRGEGELFGIPAYLDVDRVNATTLHSLNYTFQLPAKPKLIHQLSQLFGPPHLFDARFPSRGLCWPLPGGQEIIMEADEPSDSDPQVMVSVNSQVAANLIRWLEVVALPCQAQEVASVT